MRIIFLNPQGNFDKNDSFWTMHPDFGGQLVYVKELALSMTKLGHEVDIITRQFHDEKFNCFYEKFDYYYDKKNPRIVRISCGPDQFLEKEHLWQYLYEWVENIVTFYKKEGTKIDFITGHYGDGGICALMLSSILNVPYSFTGHSLGAQKMDKLNASVENFKTLDSKFQFSKRITAERNTMQYADMIFVSTKEEQVRQYSHPLYKDMISDNKRFFISPPGANTRIFAPYRDGNVEEETKNKIERTINRDINIGRRNLPFIVCASRLEAKKNHIGMLQAYANDPSLQERCNVMISLRGVENAFEDYSNMKEDELQIMDTLFEIIDTYNLIQKVSFISINSQNELADLYRYMSIRKSIFTLTSLHEPFGLAPIEAMSAGLPAVVTKYGGPSDVLMDGEGEYGVLVDVMDINDISNGYHKCFDHYDFYKSQGMKRVKENYSWDNTALVYIEAIVNVISDYQNKEILVNPYFKTLDESCLEYDYIIKKLGERKKDERR